MGLKEANNERAFNDCRHEPFLLHQQTQFTKTDAFMTQPKAIQMILKYNLSGKVWIRKLQGIHIFDKHSQFGFWDGNSSIALYVYW